MLKILYKRFFTTRFTCNQSEYWYLILVCVFLTITDRLILNADNSTLVLVGFLLSIPTTWLSITTVLRRLKDCGKDWSFIFLLLLPFVNIFMIIWIGTRKSVQT
jgi:uncharacterized membrane protein YhaH (DUF805 family)